MDHVTETPTNGKQSEELDFGAVLYPRDSDTGSVITEDQPSCIGQLAACHPVVAPRLSKKTNQL